MESFIFWRCPLDVAQMQLQHSGQTNVLPRQRSGFHSPWRSYLSLYASRPTKPSIPVNSRTTSWLLTMRFALIDHHWWYDRQLGTYDPGQVGRTLADSFYRISVQVCTVSFIVFCPLGQISNSTLPVKYLVVHIRLTLFVNHYATLISA